MQGLYYSFRDLTQSFVFAHEDCQTNESKFIQTLLASPSYRCSDNICQLRLDFNQFVISGPSTSSLTVGKALAGTATDIGAGTSVTSASQCLTDSFTVSNPGSRTPSVICGINTGQHMYVDIS